MSRPELRWWFFIVAVVTVAIVAGTQNKKAAVSIHRFIAAFPSLQEKRYNCRSEHQAQRALNNTRSAAYDACGCAHRGSGATAQC